MRKRRRDILLLALSLLLAAGMWLVHILSQSYYAYIPFRIKAVTNIEGYAPEALASQNLFLSGKTSGFFILGYNLYGKEPVETSVEIPSDKFTPSGIDPDVFVVNSSAVSDKISESVNSEMEVSFIPDAVLEFKFERRSCRKLPIVSEISLECAPQYMQTSEIVFTPDSVTVYGSDDELSPLTEIRTLRKSISGADCEISGAIGLQAPSKLRTDPPEVTYSINVGRYVEQKFTVTPTPVNVPSGKILVALPSKVEVTCRLPYGTDVSSFENDALFTLDYNDVLSSRSGKIAPKMEDTGVSAYSCSFEPPFVECIISDSAR